MHSCSEQECYGRSGFCDCDGDYEYDEETAQDSGDRAYTCGNTDPNNAKGTDRYARCGRFVNSNTDFSKRKAFRNVLCNQVCNNYNCSYELYESDDCNKDKNKNNQATAFDNFILYGSTKYGDFPVQYTPNDPKSTNPDDCQYIPEEQSSICPGQDGAWRSIPQYCESTKSGPDGVTGPWMFKSVKLKVRNGGSPKGCKVTIFDKEDQMGNSITVQYDPNVKEENGGQCIKLDFSKGMPEPLDKNKTKSAFSVEKCYTSTCTKKYSKQEYKDIGGPDQYRLAGRGVLWNDCVQFRPTYKEFCQDYGIIQGKPMVVNGNYGQEVCQLWDGAFLVTDPAKTQKISENIIKNSTVKSDGLDDKFTCVIVDVCNLPPTHKVQNEDLSVR